MNGFRYLKLAWYMPNMVAWMYSKISNETRKITGTPPSVTAYKRGSANYVTLQNQSGSKFRIIDGLDTNACQFYDED